MNYLECLHDEAILSKEPYIIVITGASSGIGQAIAVELSQNNNTIIVLIARSERKLNEIAAEIYEDGGNTIALVGDVTNEKDVENINQYLGEKFGYISVVINNAGLGIFKPFTEMTSEDWLTMHNVMVYGSFLVTKNLIPLLLNSPNSRHIIINSSFWGMRKGDAAFCAGYVAAKFAQRGLSLSLREEMRTHGIKVTCFMPASVNTPFFDHTNWIHDPERILSAQELAIVVDDIINYRGNLVIEDIVIQAIDPD